MVHTLSGLHADWVKLCLLLFLFKLQAQKLKSNSTVDVCSVSCFYFLTLCLCFDPFIQTKQLERTWQLLEWGQGMKRTAWDGGGWFSVETLEEGIAKRRTGHKACHWQFDNDTELFFSIHHICTNLWALETKAEGFASSSVQFNVNGWANQILQQNTVLHIQNRHLETWPPSLTFRRILWF